MRLPAIVIIIL